MGITEYQRKQRSKFIGSSDIAAIAGLSPFATARDVWCEKTYDMEPRKESTEMRRGNYTELSLLKFAEDELGTKITPNQRRVKGVCAANIDGICRLPNSRAFSKDGIEAKSSNCGWEYGVEGTDQVPDFVALQCAHEMYCGELERIFIPVYAVRFGRMSMELFRLNRDEDIIKKIVKIATNFWYNHVLMGIIPPGATPVNIEILKRIRREPEKIIAFDNSDTVLAWEAARKKRLEAEKAESYLLSQVNQRALARSRQRQPLYQIGVDLYFTKPGSTKMFACELVFMCCRRRRTGLRLHESKGPRLHGSVFQ